MDDNITMIDGITTVYKKTYLDNDMYRFDYSHVVNGCIDPNTGLFYDEFDNELPFIRDTNFLESKEILGHYNFISHDDLEKKCDETEDECLDDIFEEIMYEYEQEAKNKMFVVSIFDNEEDIDTVLTEIDLDNIHKNAMNYYMDFVNELGQVKYRKVQTIRLDYSVNDLLKLVNNDKYSIDELKRLKEIYQVPYNDCNNIIKTCEELLSKSSNGLYKDNVKDRDSEFNMEDSFEINELIDMLNKHLFTIDEIKMLYDSFSVYLTELKPLLESINKKLTKEEIDLKENVEEEKNEQEKIQEKILDNDQEKEVYSLDDLKKLKDKIKESLVGQDEPLRRLISELSRMRDKNFEDNVGILLSGDSGVGKTFMVQLIAKYLDIPFVRVDSTSLTVPGYVGKDLEEVLWELYEASGKNIEKAERGIIFFDEIDKKGSNSKDDIAGKGVLNHLLTLLDGTDIYACKSTKGFSSSSETKLNSKHMIIIAAGSFPDVYNDKKTSVGFKGDTEEKEDPYKTPNTNVFVEKAMMSSDFMNRFPIRIRLNPIKEEDFVNNFKNGNDSPIKWETSSFLKHGVKLKVTEDFIKKASSMSIKEGSGFRGAKGIILTATSDALDEIKENEGKYSEIVLTEETLNNPLVYKKVKKKRKK